MKNFHELTDQALSTKLNADYTRLAEGRQQFIFEKTLEILNESDVEMRSLKREEQMIRDQLKEREFSQKARPGPHEEGGLIDMIARGIRELPRFGAKVSETSKGLEPVDRWLRSMGVFGPDTKPSGQSFQERDEKVKAKIQQIEDYSKQIEKQGYKSWEDVPVPEEEIKELEAWKQRTEPSRPGQEPKIPTLRLKRDLKAYREFQNTVRGKSVQQLRDLYEKDPDLYSRHEEFMPNTVAIDLKPANLADETLERGLPKGVSARTARTMRDFGENLPEITAIAAAASMAPGLVTTFTRAAGAAVPAIGRNVSPSAAGQLTSQALTTGFGMQGAAGLARSQDVGEAGLNAMLALPAAKTIAGSARLGAGGADTSASGFRSVFNDALAKARERELEILDRQRAKAEARAGAKEGRLEGGRRKEERRTSNIEKDEAVFKALPWLRIFDRKRKVEPLAQGQSETTKPERAEIAAETSAQARKLPSELAYDVAKDFTLARIEAQARGAERPEIPSFEKQTPKLTVQSVQPEKEKEAKKINPEKLGEREAVEGPSSLSQAVGVARDVADIPKNVATNISDWIKGKIKEIGAIGKPSLSSPKPSPSIRGRLFSWEKAIEGAIKRAKETVGEIKRVGAKEAAATALAASAMILPEPAGRPIAAHTPKTVEVIRINEPGKLPSASRPTASGQPSVPETKIEPTLPNEGGMNKPVSLPEYEPTTPGEGGMNKPVSLPEYEPITPKKTPSTWDQMIKDLQKEFETIKTAEPAPAPDLPPPPAAEPEPAPAPDLPPPPAAEPEPAPAPDPEPPPAVSQLTWDEILNKIKSQEKNIEPKPQYVSDAEPVASPETRQAPPPEKLEEPTRREPLPPPSDNIARNVPPIIPITPANRPPQRQQPNIPEPPKGVPSGPPPVGKRQQEREYSPAPVKAPSTKTKTETPPVAPVTQEKQVSGAPAVVVTTIPSKDTEIEQQKQETQTKQQDKNVDQNVNQIDTSKIETKKIETQNTINAIAPVAIPAATALTAWLLNNLQSTTSSAGDSSGKLRSNKTTTTGSANVPALPGTAQETEEEEIDTETTKKLKDWNLDWTEIYSKYAKTLSK